MSPAVSPEAKDVMLARAVFLLTDQPSTPLLPALPPGRWRRPSEMARELGVSESAVGRAITALGFREQEEHRRSILDQKRHGEGQGSATSGPRQSSKRFRDTSSGLRLQRNPCRCQRRPWRGTASHGAPPWRPYAVEAP
jgi:hypothetical protein